MGKFSHGQAFASQEKVSRGLNFANWPLFCLIFFILLGVFKKIMILNISLGLNFAKIAKMNPREDLPTYVTLSAPI